MSILKKVKWNVILSSVIYVAMGVLLLLWPEMITKNICYVIGFLAIAIGIVNLIDYIRHDITLEGYRYSLVTGLASILIGIFIVLKVELVMSIIPFLLGLAVTISGFMKFQNAVDLIRLKYNGWVAVLLISIVNIVFGIILMSNPFTSAIVLTICIGVGMIYSGVSDLIATIMLSRSIKKVVKEIETDVVN